jgi:hypothetical protein
MLADDSGRITSKPEVNRCKQAITRFDPMMSAMAMFHQLSCKANVEFNFDFVFGSDARFSPRA